METILAFVIGGLFAVAIYLMMRRSLARVIMGLSVLTNAINLLIFTIGGLTPGQPPIIPEGAEQLTTTYADPVPQALILTAIVIGFGVLAFTLVLAFRVYETTGSDDVDDMRATDQLTPPPDEIEPAPVLITVRHPVHHSSPMPADGG